MEENQLNVDKNLEIFLEQYNDINGIDKSIRALNIFTCLKPSNRLISIMSFSNLLFYHIIKTKKGYTLFKNNRKYPFKILSDEIGRKVDERYLLDYKERNLNAARRSLKLACSTDLTNANFIVASTSIGVKFLIEYQENHNLYIIDYSSNLKMKKTDYKKLYGLKEVSRVDRYTMYKMYHLLTDYTQDLFNPFYLFLFPEEIQNKLSELSDLKWLNQKHKNAGINLNNHYWLGEYCDCLYFEADDYQETEDYKRLNDFTKNPECDNNYFFYDDKINYYYYLKNEEKIYFRLISDYIESDDIKDELLSDSRYNHCHENSIRLSLGMKINNAKNYLVNGKCKINEKDYYYHSWMEAETEEGQIVVFDYNSNIIMSKQNYYKLFEAVTINKTDADSLTLELKLLDEFNINLYPLEIGYFSQEIIRDLEKNKFLIKNKEVH